MKKVLLFAVAGSAFLFSCHKSKDNTTTTTVTESQVITDFVGKIALPQYQTLQDKATALNTAVTTLNTTTNDANLAAAQAAWRDVRSSWEACEGFLIGPVEDDNYDPNMDTWPVDHAQLDSFMNASSTSNINVTTVSALGQSLRGFHPLEYILWGTHGTATAASINANAKDKAYMVALAADILNTCTSLNNSWLATGGNFQAQVLNTSTRFPTRQSVFLAIVAGMSDICDEVGNGKMKEPFDALDSTKTESPFSHNSMIDFTNNIQGASNVYLCNVAWAAGASSLSKFVAQKNLSLDNKIKSQYAAAIAALNNVTVTFEAAIYLQPTQLRAAMAAINTLQATLDGDLKTFVTTYVKD